MCIRNKKLKALRLNAILASLSSEFRLADEVRVRCNAILPDTLHLNNKSLGFLAGSLVEKKIVKVGGGKCLLYKLKSPSS